MNVHVKAHTKSKPYASLKASTHRQLVRDLLAEQEACFEAAMNKMERELSRLVAHLVRKELV